MNKTHANQNGFSLIELMIVTLIALLLSYVMMHIYVAQSQLYKTNNSQSLIQNTENAIANLVTPVIRSAGFLGCSSVSTVISNLNGSGSNPLASLNTTQALISGYTSTNTSISNNNADNDDNAASWIPTLDASLAGAVQNSSDVLIVLGAVPGSFPVGITDITTGSTSFTVQTITGENLTNGQLGAISDCVKTSVFQITNISGTTISHAAGSGAYANNSDIFDMSYQIGTQFIPIQQTAFFVAHGQGGQSTLMRAILTHSGWDIQALVPGVNVLKIRYGIGVGGVINQYVAANAVANWAQVYSVRLGFLIEGERASGIKNTTQYSVLGTSITVPEDHRLRHVYEITINLRNAVS